MTPTPATQSLGEADAAPAELRGRMDPIARLLDRRRDLDLTGEQIARLEAVQLRLGERNGPLIEQLRSLRPEDGTGPWLFRSGPGEPRHHGMRELSEEQREERRARIEAHRERMSELTPEERAELREQMLERHGEAVGPEARERILRRFEGRHREPGERDPDSRPQLSEEQRERREQRLERFREHAEQRAELMEQVRPILEQLHTNSQEAMEQAYAVLTEEQRSRYEALRAERLERMRERMGERREHTGERPMLRYRVRPDGAVPDDPQIGHDR